jgi:NaMN:DMB phosphoribosyltransferase
MQPALALMALEASLAGPTVLGGGTQMASVYALMARLVEEGEAGDLSNVALATTSWVAADTAADLAGILAGISPPVAAFAAWLDFSNCRAAGLRRYEEGLVKEGVGAGAAAFAALVSGAARVDTLTERIERIVEEIDGHGKN